MERQNSSIIITTNRISINQEFIDDKSGILNSLAFASANYVYKVIEKHCKGSIKQFDAQKLKKLKRTIIHTNAHLDEYFAELIFRAILPPYLKDLEINAHVLLSKDEDSYAKISWPHGVVFGISSEDAGGAKALAFFDEHNTDGTRDKHSCSQLVAEEFLGDKIPKAIKIVLDEVNASDSRKGAHEYNLKNIISVLHDQLFVIDKDEFTGNLITKYLTEDWKRAIIDACITSVIYGYENSLIPAEFNEKDKLYFEKLTKNSLDEFIDKTLLKEYSHYFEKVKGSYWYKFKVGNHTALDNTYWKNEEGKNMERQIFVLQIVCFALKKCWGDNIAQFIMTHIWQVLFQKDLNFEEIKEEILSIKNESEITNTKFGNYQKLIIQNNNIQPEQKTSDKRKREFKKDSPIWLYNVTLSNPFYSNLATVLKSILNGEYSSKGNNGFGLILLHDKTINSKLVNSGMTLPYLLWEKICKEIFNNEEDRWFFLKQSNGQFADFALNRNKAHQEHLPSEIVDSDFIIKVIERK